MDELINKVTEKAGINPEQAKNAIHAVMDFVKEKMPGIGDKIAGLISGGGGGAGDLLGDIRKKFGI